jgi:hypothetical protein
MIDESLLLDFFEDDLTRNYINIYYSKCNYYQNYTIINDLPDLAINSKAPIL